MRKLSEDINTISKSIKIHGRYALWVAISIIILLLTTSLFVSRLIYALDPDPWVSIEPIKDIDSISVNGIYGSLWAANLYDKELYHYSFSENQSNQVIFESVPIEIETRIGISKICPSNQLIIVLNNKIASFDPQTITAITKDQYSFNDSWICSNLPDNSTAVWSDEILSIIKDGKTREIDISHLDPVFNITQEQGGNIWVLTNNNEIYYFMTTSNEWIFFDKIKVPIIPSTNNAFFITSDKSLWFTGINKLYRWDLVHVSTPSVIIETTSSKIYYLIEENINANEVWIVTGTEIQIYHDGKLKSIPLPRVNSIITDADYDPSLNRLYVSTFVGIFYLDLE